MIEGCVEVSRRDDRIISASRSEDDMYVHCQCGGSYPREATQEEVEEALEYYNKKGKCKFHIFKDTRTGLGYYFRDCLVCGTNIGLI